MSRETDAILQSILFHIRREKEFGKGDIVKILRAVEAMCTKENLDAVEVLITKEREESR